MITEPNFQDSKTWRLNLELKFILHILMHPSERGSNEKCNQLIRYCIPKGTDINFLDIELIKFVQLVINNKKRKILGLFFKIYFIVKFGYRYCIFII